MSVIIDGTNGVATSGTNLTSTSLILNGSTSGAITLAANAVAGTNTLTLPAQTSTLATNLQAPVGQCRLAYSNATTLTLSPYQGQYIKISGALYAIPSAGITVSNSGLSASTLYYAYANVSSGSVNLSISATGHSTDSTAGNVGVEIQTGNNAYTLVGMIYTNGSSQFQDNSNARGVLSFFNRRIKSLFGTGSNYSTTNTAQTIVSGIYFSGLTWADTPMCAWVGGQTNTTGSYGLMQAIYDNNLSNNYGMYQFIYGVSGVVYPTQAGGWVDLSEGWHTFYIALGASSGSGTISINNSSGNGSTSG